MDPTNNRVVLDMSTLFTYQFSYDPTVPVSHTEFVARQERMERDSIERARSNGQHPNPQLCHTCRLVKPLEPTNEHVHGFD